MLAKQLNNIKLFIILCCLPNDCKSYKSVKKVNRYKYMISRLGVFRKYKY